MQERLLRAHNFSRLSIYALWVPMYPGDCLEKVPQAQKLLDDPRVSPFWDGEQELARWFKTNVLPSFTEAMDSDPGEVERFLGRPLQDEAIWDVYLLYAGEAWWDAIPEPLTGWGCPVVEKGEQLLGEARLLLSKKALGKSGSRDFRG